MNEIIINNEKQYLEHLEHHLSLGYKNVEACMTELEPGIYTGSFIGDFSYGITNKDTNNLRIWYYAHILLKNTLIRVNITRETAKFIFNYNIDADFWFIILKIGKRNLPFLNPYYEFDFSKNLSEWNFKSWLSDIKIGDIIKFQNGRVIYRIENVDFKENELTINYISAHGEEYFKSYRVDEILEIIQTQNEIDFIHLFESAKFPFFKKVIIPKESFDVLPLNPIDYPHPFKAIKNSVIESLQNENWYAIPSYEGLYEISNYGRIKSLNYQGFLFNEDILQSNEIKFYKDQICEYQNRNHLLQYIYLKNLNDELFVENLVTTIEFNEGSKLIKYDRYLELWYINIYKDKNYICYFLNFSICKNAVSKLLSSGFSIMNCPKSIHCEDYQYLSFEL